MDFDTLNLIDKARYTLLYMFGDKIGGFNAIASMNIEEVIKILNLFLELK